MSLSESCLAVAIFVTIAMIAVPPLMDIREDYLVSAAARQIAGRMHAARIRAVSENRDCRLRVTSPATYSIECEHTGWIPLEYGTTPKGIRITANAVPEFHRRGNVSPMATLTLSNARGRQRSVIVNIAGRIRVQ
jgi:Tfp pilus assembly protein FimT